MCKDPVNFEYLVAYWLAELPAAEEGRIEEHVFGCAHCAGRLEWVAGLAEGVRAAVRGGAIGLVVPAAFVEAMKGAGMRLREYRLEPGETVNCTIRADDDAVVSRIRAPLAGAGRVDLLQRIEVGGAEQAEVRLEDVPFDPRSGEVLFLPPAAWLKKMPANTMRVRLVSLGEAGEARIGEYTFAHTPS
jgi:hypothetical protein